MATKEENKKAKPAADKKPAEKKPQGAKKGSKGAGAAQSGPAMAAAGETKVSPEITPRLAQFYKEKAVPSLMKQFQFKNSMQVPRFVKVVVNCAAKEAVGNPKVIDSALNDIMTITGQKPVIRRAKKAIAAFKVRKGNSVAVSVTLRRARMFEFLDRLVNIALPRVRDFKGISNKAFDGRGNYSLGLKEQIIFPEINYDKVDSLRGMTITIVTSATNNEQARALLNEIGMPFRK